ncbi:MAG: type II toxin-antitoxin system VapC family toxin [Pyrinomonadaceae bacterium]
MVTAIDTNVLVALWTGDEESSEDLQKALDNASEKGGLSICGAVFAELLASPRVTESFIEEFCSDAGISIDWLSNETIWKTAGLAYRQYAANRRRRKSGQPRRILTDFLIGAHALKNGHALLTLDTRIFRTAFPMLSLLRV